MDTQYFKTTLGKIYKEPCFKFLNLNTDNSKHKPKQN